MTHSYFQYPETGATKLPQFISKSSLLVNPIHLKVRQITAVRMLIRVHFMDI
jgi:hypothetical protein